MVPASQLHAAGLGEVSAPRAAAGSWHGEKQFHPRPHKRGCGGLQGRRRAENPARTQGEQRGPGSPGLAQACVLTQMGVCVAQGWEHGSAALAFPAFVATQALCSTGDSVASSWVPGVGGKRQGTLPAAVPTSHSPCTPPGTHAQEGRAGAGPRSPRLARAWLAARTFSVTPEQLAPWGSWPCKPSTHGGLGNAACHLPAALPLLGPLSSPLRCLSLPSSTCPSCAAWERYLHSLSARNQVSSFSTSSCSGAEKGEAADKAAMDFWEPAEILG